MQVPHEAADPVKRLSQPNQSGDVATPPQQCSSFGEADGRPPRRPSGLCPTTSADNADCGSVVSAALIRNRQSSSQAKHGLREGLLSDVVDRTRHFWAERTRMQISDEDAREAIRNASALFSLLGEWDQQPEGETTLSECQES